MGSLAGRQMESSRTRTALSLLCSWKGPRGISLWNTRGAPRGRSHEGHPLEPCLPSPSSSPVPEGQAHSQVTRWVHRAEDGRGGERAQPGPPPTARPGLFHFLWLPDHSAVLSRRPAPRKQSYGTPDLRRVSSEGRCPQIKTPGRSHSYVYPKG